MIFLDTSILIRENFFRSPSALLFLRATQFLGIKIIIPQIVIDEIKGKYPLNLIEKHRQFDKQRKQINNLTQKKVADLDLLYENKLFSKWINKVINFDNLEVLPYPKISLEEIVRASYKLKKPFKENGEGYKDYIIWESIVSYINNHEGNEEFYFLTGNVRDFCVKKDDKLMLHEDLTRHIDEEKRPIVVYTNLKDYFDEKIRCQLNGINVSDVPDLSLEKLKKIAEEKVEESLAYYSTYGIEGLQFANDVTVSGVHGVTIEDWEAAELDQNEFLISFSGKVEVEADGFIEKHEYFMDEYEELFINDPDWNERVMAVSQTIETPFRLEMIYSKCDANVGGHSIILENEISEY